MRRKLLFLFLILAFCMPTSIYAIEAHGDSQEMDIIEPSGSKTTLNMSTYKINGFNYFQLRSLANYMNNTAKKFDVNYNQKDNSIYITTNKEYSDYNPLAFADKVSGKENARVTSQKIYIDGTEVNLEGYNIKDNNYFKLRDLGKVFNFHIDYDANRNAVIIDPQKPSSESLQKIEKKNENKSEISDTNTGNILGDKNYFCYIPAKDAAYTIKVAPGYVAEIRNSKITSFKESSDTVKVPKGTAILYMNYAQFKNKTINIDGIDSKMSQSFIQKWIKKDFFVPVVKGEKINGFDGAIDITYISFVDLKSKYDEVTEVLAMSESEIYERYSDYENMKKDIVYSADRGQVYKMAEQGINIGYTWWLYNIPEKHEEKLEQMIHYALSVQGFSYSQFDCSGLVGTAGELAGLEIAPAYSWIIEEMGVVDEIPMKDLKRGDLLNKAGSHIMIYIGNGKVVESVPKDGVRVANVRKNGYKALRIKKF